MYLSRLTLNARDRQARSWLGDCHNLHREIMFGFRQVDEGPARERLGVLYRVEATDGAEAVTVIVQSAERPSWTFGAPAVYRVDGPKDLAPIEAKFEVGARFRFRLRANPTRRVHPRAATCEDTHELDTSGKWRPAEEIPAAERTGVVRRLRPDNQAAVGKRVELTREEERLAWLARRGEAGAGFELVSARIAQGIDDASRRDFVTTRSDPGARLRSFDRKLTFATALFEGELRITDAGAFRSAFAGGIGPGKAFGCGLLSLARPEP